MTREEAIKILKEIEFPVNGDNREHRDTAFDIAIKALEQEPKTGHWIDGVCSECGWDAGQEAFSEDANFCMKCGVKMLPVGAEKE